MIRLFWAAWVESVRADIRRVRRWKDANVAASVRAAMTSEELERASVAFGTSPDLLRRFIVSELERPATWVQKQLMG
ncbi:MAG: hypothetical protein QJR08_04250 [Bacillota bacterium]|nr:hypothetical protein [Bacillota bacterium]